MSYHSRAGNGLVEYLMSVALGGLLIAAICSFSFHSSRSFATIFNMVDNDQANSRTISQLAKDFRQVQSVTNVTSTSIIALDANGQRLIYGYDPAKQILSRVAGGTSNVLLRDLSYFDFEMQQRNVSNAFDFFPTTNLVECKALTFEWSANRTLMGSKQEDLPQRLTVVIRN